MTERPIWTAGMEAINRALSPAALEEFRQEELRRSMADNYREVLRKYNLRRPDGDQ